MFIQQPVFNNTTCRRGELTLTPVKSYIEPNGFKVMILIQGLIRKKIKLD